MIGLDTNILVRSFAGDDPVQSARAVRLIDGSAAEGLFVNVVVLVEFAWTMRRAFRWDEDRIRIALNNIVRHPALVIQHRDCVLESITLTDKRSAGFADRLIGMLNRENGCETTLTFDRGAADEPEFRLLTT